MAWHGIEEMAEALQLAIMNLHALGPEGSAHAFVVPRHDIALTENVARKLMRKGEIEAALLDREESSRD